MIKEIKAEAIYVLILWIIITNGIMICDISYRLSDNTQNWEYHLDAQTKFDTAITTEV